MNRVRVGSAIAMASLSLVAGCSDAVPPVGASATSPPASFSAGPAGPTTGAGAGDLAAYAKCLRSNGIPDFPDPGPDGTLGLPRDVDLNSVTFKQAEEKCEQYKPAGQPRQPGDASASPAP